MKRTTAAETAARFLSTYRRSMRVRGIAPRSSPNPEPRWILNVATPTLDELKACVDERIARCHAENKEPPHITLIARTMLDEATKTEAR